MPDSVGIGLVVLIVGWALGLFLLITWAVFPFLVLGRMDKAIKHLKSIDDNLKRYEFERSEPIVNRNATSDP